MKKGQFSYVKGLIVMVVIMLFSTVLIANVLKKTDEVIEESECYKSIQAHKQMLQITDGTYAPDIICPTLYEPVKETKEYDIKKLLADDMIKAWNLWKGSTFFVGEEEIFCHVYKVYSFKKKGLVIDNFKQFLFDEEIGYTGVTYADYIAPKMSKSLEGIEKRVEEHEQKELEPFIINTDNNYAIIFKHIKGKPKIFGNTPTENIKQNGMAIGVGGGVLIGAKAGALAAGLFCSPTVLGSIVCSAVGGIAGGAGGAIAYYFLVDPNDPQNFASYVIVQPYNEEGFGLSDCTKLPVSQAEKKS